MGILIQDFQIKTSKGFILGNELILTQLKDQSLPLVVFYHGWTGSSDAHIHFAVEIARQGFRVIAPDALYHGRRMIESQIELDQFLEVLSANINEFEDIIEHYQETIANRFVGVAGMSMGAITSLLLLSKFSYISAAVSLMGTPNITDFITRKLDVLSEKSDELTIQTVRKNYPLIFHNDLSRNVEKICHRPLFMWHGENDTVVDFDLTNDFVKQYKDTPELEFLYYLHEASDHKVPFKEIVRMGEFFKASYHQEKNQIWTVTQSTMTKRLGPF
ncbi:alpha/beta fold hydrolase [Facklamia sp. DSM 111018]|uniref:Alpha/beta fold hydrolase n=1 Tax=Facklamia lactis TaxID=2749967 RepID=A0ABS0LM79_9LACT|nr:alpha/beta fold hydrolase [Facklamia lactis]MBG9985280.1 alpha/beta fold hydrolase [Facklamia lactis]